MACTDPGTLPITRTTSKTSICQPFRASVTLEHTQGGGAHPRRLSISDTFASSTYSPIITASGTTNSFTILTPSTFSSTLTVTSTSSLPPQGRRPLSRPPPPIQRLPCARHLLLRLAPDRGRYPSPQSSPLSPGSCGINPTALITGVTSAALILALGAVFIYDCAQKRRIDFMETIKRIRREGKAASAVGLPDDEVENTTHQRYKYLPNTPV
ncbi:hypothetical protein IW262DRAFT_1459420 [Armillaria fumosa]|nr:hypothetical protein IW262DRAFT_1459420 [Armillaria fumosa]